MQNIWNVLKSNKRRILYMICFAFACLIDQRTKTCTGLDGWLESFRDLTGVVMAVVIMSHYRFSEIKKWRLPYLVWSLLCVVALVPAILWGRANRPYLNAWCVLLLDIILFGYILIHTFIDVMLEKNCPKLNKKFALLWLLMMVLMIVSRSSYIWPVAYLVMFGCFYLTNYTREEQNDLLQGMLDGIILSFFLMQGWCFVFRPFDEQRYPGVYSNCNLNALYYLVVLAAVFAKLIYCNRIHANKWIKLYYWLGIGTVLSFMFMTIGRSAWLTAALMGFIFLVALTRLQKKGFIRFIQSGVILVLCACLTFPLCFGAARYLPPVFHHPVWFWGEWAESKVHSWDKWDSEKFIDMDEFMDAALGRIVDTVTDLVWGEREEQTVNVEVVQQQAPVSQAAEQKTTEQQATEQQTAKSESIEAKSIETQTSEKVEKKEEAAEQETDPRKIPALTFEQSEDSYLVRMTIYKHYISNLNLFGHPYEEQGFQMTPIYWIGHAHNIYLQYGTDFGIPVMILFVVLILGAVICFGRRIYKACDEHSVGGLMFVLVPAVFGILEYSWGVGSVTILLLFVVWRKVICEES